jgi:hypothetical protein
MLIEKLWMFVYSSMLLCWGNKWVWITKWIQ